MATMSTRPNLLKWTGGYYNREALWPQEPSIIVIKSLALKYLASEVPDTLDLNRLEVQFFAQGGFNKLYSISCSGHSTTYLLRVALPLIPYYRIESEAAVLSYLKANTSIPVARVIAWDSSAATDLGFEWILLEKIEGVALYEIWRKVPWESKLDIVSALAPILGQLRDHKFDRIGSLYFKGRESQPDPEYPSNTAFLAHGLLNDSLPNASRSKHDENRVQHERQASKVPCVEPAETAAQEHDSPPEAGLGGRCITSAYDTSDSRPESAAEEVEDPTTQEESERNRYIVGPLLDSLFFLYRRLHLPGNRGPFQNSREWLAAQMDFQMSWIKTGPLITTSANPQDFDRYDWDSDCDAEAPEMEQLIDDYLRVLPEVYPAAEGVTPYVLYHHDLSLANILVNPDNYAITGIIDWEKIQVVPDWRNSRFPKFLTDQIDFEEIDDEEPRIPTSAECDEDSEDHNPAAVERRDRWDNAILRQHYDKALSRTRGETEFCGSTNDSAQTRREFEVMTMEITEESGYARRWLERYSEKKLRATENS